MSYHAIPCHAMSCHAIPCHTISYHVIPCHTMSYHVIPCHTMSYLREWLCNSLPKTRSAIFVVASRSQPSHFVLISRMLNITKAFKQIVTARNRGTDHSRDHSDTEPLQKKALKKGPTPYCGIIGRTSLSGDSFGFSFKIRFWGRRQAYCRGGA